MKNAYNKKFYDVATSQQNISRQIIRRQFFLKRNISHLKKKSGPCKIQTEDFRRPRRNRYA